MRIAFEHRDWTWLKPQSLSTVLTVLCCCSGSGQGAMFQSSRVRRARARTRTHSRTHAHAQHIHTQVRCILPQNGIRTFVKKLVKEEGMGDILEMSEKGLYSDPASAAQV
jgi:hypothetical protein